MKKNLVFLLLILVTIFSFSGKIRIAQQFGLGYAPLLVVKHMNLIEKYAPGTEVEWMTLGSGAAINEALIAGKLDIGSMGVGPYLIGVDKGAPWKMATPLVVQPLGLQTNNDNIKSLKDIKPTHRIALPSPGSIQHILLAMAAEKELGNARALDMNIVAMAHPDGANALISGSGGITAHFTSPPYIFEELKSENIHQVVDAFDAAGEKFTFLVSVATEKFHNNNPELYSAFVNAINEAMYEINYNTDEVAELLTQDFDLGKETIKEYLTWEGTNFTSTPYGIERFISFMKKVGYLRNDLDKNEELYWENVLAIIGKQN
ncbi:ABC transporter substrate-binding protein [Geotoga petraea]|uniref:NitT/TauT family transport system substrate-binding protein n=1 Tax=Geotoga petraea TaxID=28234 RepID=A0A1G6PJP5_9BACT|nr:ABC transporter substrate-binding protein [Geotoga petraea]SDC79585.1 NitT/TauT family transport system substrate-binding protein [Geotoga petraea]